MTPARQSWRFQRQQTAMGHWTTSHFFRFRLVHDSIKTYSHQLNTSCPTPSRYDSEQHEPSETAAVEAKLLAEHRGVSKSYNLKSTLPSSSMVVLLWTTFYGSLVLHGEIGAPLSMYDNPFVHVSQRLQWDKSASLSHGFPVAVASQGCCPLHSAGTIHRITLLVVLGAARILHQWAQMTVLRWEWPRSVRSINV